MQLEQHDHASTLGRDSLCNRYCMCMQCTLACDSELQCMMCLAFVCAIFMCACSLLLHIVLCICSDWIEAIISLRSVEEGEQNVEG